jgi:Zn-dependent protease with chaperone function
MPIIHYNTRSTAEALADKVAVTNSEYDKIAEEAEKKAAEDYEAYELDLLNFARLGNFYIGGILVLLALAIVFCVQHFHGYGGGKLILLCGALIVLILMSLWVGKNNPPQGILLEREDYPKLFSLIDEVSQKANTHADVVLLTHDYNAMVTQFSKGGFLGGSKNYLSLGLPLMMAQGEKQFASIIAHEFGHLSNNHGESTEWIYNTIVRWRNLLNNLEDKNILIRPFFSWYIPRLDAKAGVLYRKHELDADQLAIDFAGAEAYSEALFVGDIRVNGYSSACEKVFKLARFEKEPPKDVFLRLQNGMNYMSALELRKWSNEALAHEGTKEDTHPPLKVRLAHAKCLERFENISDEELANLCAPLPVGTSSAEILLGDKLAEHIKYMNDSWHEGEKESWLQKHESMKEMEAYLEELDEKAKQGELSLNELRAKANVLDDLGEEEKCIAVRYEIVAKEPDDPYSNYEIGRYLVEKKIEFHESVDASKFLLKSYHRNLLVADNAQYLSAVHFTQHKREDEIKQLDVLKKEIEDAFKERASVKDSDEFLENDFSEEMRSSLVEWLGSDARIKTLYVVRKKVNLFPDSIHYVISMNVDGIPSDEMQEFGKSVLNESYMLGFTRSVFIVDTWNLKLDKKIKSIPNSLIFKRKGKEIEVG